MPTSPPDLRHGRSACADCATFQPGVRTRSRATSIAGTVTGGVLGTAGAAAFVGQAAAGIAPCIVDVIRLLPPNMLLMLSTIPAADVSTITQTVLSSDLGQRLAGYAGNVLAGWVANWATCNANRVRWWRDHAYDDDLSAILARELEDAIASNILLLSDLMRLLQTTDAVSLP